MGHEDDGAPLGVELLEEHEYLEAGARVEVARGFVGEDYGGVVDQGAGYGYALHLSARHLVAVVVEPLAQSYGLEGDDGTLLALVGTHGGVVHERQLDILHAGGLGEQVVVLEDEPYLAVAQNGAVVAAHGAHAHTVEVVFAARRRVEAAKLVEQGGLSRARLAHDGDKLALVYLEAHSLEGVHGLVAHLEVAAHVVEIYHDSAVVVVGCISHNSPFCIWLSCPWLTSSFLGRGLR